MIRLLALALLLFVGPAGAQLTTSGVGGGFGRNASGGAGGCSQATTYLARTSGENTTAVTSYICGLVSNGLITGNLTSTGCGSLFDGLYIFASANHTDADLNVCSNTNYNITENAIVTFTANTGWVAGNSNGYLDTGFNPTTAVAPNFTQNSAHVSTWVSTDPADNRALLGMFAAASGETDIYNDFVGQSYFRINDAAGSGGVGSNSTGHYVSNRSGASAQQGYINAVNKSVSSGSSAAPPNLNLVILNFNSSGSIILGSTANQMVVSFGASLTSGQVSTFCHLTNVYLTAVAGVGAGIC